MSNHQMCKLQCRAITPSGRYTRLCALHNTCPVGHRPSCPQMSPATPVRMIHSQINKKAVFSKCACNRLTMQASPIQLPPPLRQSHSAGKIARRRCSVAHLIFHGGLAGFRHISDTFDCRRFTSSVVLWITVLLTKFCVVRATTEVDFIRSEERGQHNTTAILPY